MASKLPLESFRLTNFKAIRDSGVVEFTPLTVLIGDNGSGKSSLVEGLQTYREIISHNVDSAMQSWLGFENISNPPFDTREDAHEIAAKLNSIEFIIRGHVDETSFGTQLRLTSNPFNNEVYIDTETLEIDDKPIIERNESGVYSSGQFLELQAQIPRGYSFIAPIMGSLITLLQSPHNEVNQETFSRFIDDVYGFDWQFVAFIPQGMGSIRLMDRSGSRTRLRHDGANIAEYLLDIRRRDEEAFGSIVETIKFILPYAKSLSVNLTSELERAVYLQLTEADFNVPGWLFSTGTLRVLALLALFRDPDPPPVIVIEELENGLDPRAIHLIVDEIQSVVESGRSQVIVTTHSPYLLNLLPLWSIVLVERKDGEPTFSRPAKRDDIENWSRRFAPGDLYTMGALSSENGA